MTDDLTKKLPRTDSEKLTLILTTVQNLDTRVTNIEVRLTNLEQRFDRLEQRLDNLEQKVEERLYETRPIWQKVVADIAQFQEGQNRLEGEVREINVSIRNIVFEMSAQSDTMRMIQGKHKDFDLRVRELEHKHKNPTNSQT
jgi:chromosome segregation ATPase